MIERNLHRRKRPCIVSEPDEEHVSHAWCPCVAAMVRILCEKRIAEHHLPRALGQEEGVDSGLDTRSVRVRLPTVRGDENVFVKD